MITWADLESVAGDSAPPFESTARATESTLFGLPLFYVLRQNGCSCVEGQSHPDGLLLIVLAP